MPLPARTLPVVALLLLAAACASDRGPEAAPSAPPPAPADAARITSGFSPLSGRYLPLTFDQLALPAPTPERLATGAPGPGYWQQRVDYDIEATLDADAETITAVAQVTYTNNSPHGLPHLWLNLDQNLFNPSSTGARLTTPGARFGNRDGFEGGFVLDRVRHADADLPLHVFDTIARLDLPEPIAPRGGVFTFRIGWSFRVPPYGSDRLGIEKLEQGKVFEIAQWFPNVCVYDDVYGWNTLPYLGQAEFYTNFGDYDVRLTVPRNHVVVATGVLQNPEGVLAPQALENYRQARSLHRTVAIRSEQMIADGLAPDGQGPLTWRFKAEGVRTFAWASGDALIWDGRFLPGAGPLGDDGQPTGVFVQSAYPKEAAPLWRQSTDMLAQAIGHYSAKWFNYPYPSAVNVNGRVGGMEYPMIIFCRNRTEERGLFGVTTHEIGHNWFPMLVSTDERRHAWMDEGFNTFINYYSNLERYPETLPHRGHPRRFAAEGGMRPDLWQPAETPPDQLGPGLLGLMEYARPAAALVLLREQVLGEERFDAAFRAYLRRWAFKSPRPADFFRTMEDVSGADLDWFWRAWFYSTARLDQAVHGVTTSEDGAEAHITFRNLGTMVMPVVFRLTFEPGPTTETRTLPVEAWFAADEWTTRVPLFGRTLTEVLIDPEEAFPDAEPANNRWAR